MPRPPQSPATHQRNVAIYSLIYHNRFDDLLPTRSIGALPYCCFEGGSACDVVGKAAGMNYKNVEGIWDKRDRILGSYKRNKK